MKKPRQTTSDIGLRPSAFFRPSDFGPRISFSPTALVLPPGLGEKEWAAIGRKLTRANQVIAWWLGDWAAFGLDHYENGRLKYHVLKEFAQANNVPYQTLANYAWVSRNVTISRRRENVDWSKHAEIAPLPPEEQAAWLDKTEQEELPVAALRSQIRISQGDENALQSDGPVLDSGLRHLDALLAWLHDRPAGFWSEKERRKEWFQRLTPLVDLHAELCPAPDTTDKILHSRLAAWSATRT